MPHQILDQMVLTYLVYEGTYCQRSKPALLCGSVVGAVPCRIAFERGKERHFHFLAITIGTSGWLILADELPVRPSFGVVRVVAPLGGCNVSIPFLGANTAIHFLNKLCAVLLGRFFYKND